MVCEKLERLFKEVLDCRTRISVEYVFYKPLDGEQVKRYIGIATNVDEGTQKVDFIIQIDFLDNYKFGRHDTGIPPYTRIIASMVTNQLCPT